MAEKKYSMDQILDYLRNRDAISPEAPTSEHISMDDIFQYLENRYQLSNDETLKKSVLNHIFECQECYRNFVFAHEFMVDMESNSIPEADQESKNKAYEIVLNTQKDYTKEITLLGMLYVLMARYKLIRRILLGPAGDEGDKRLVSENEAFRCEIEKRQDNLVMLVATKKKEFSGSYIVISISSAHKVDYHNLIQWEQSGPTSIISAEPIGSDGRTEILIGKTSLKIDNEENFRLLERVFEEIDLRVYKKKSD